jgi:hypothetical protein
MAPAATPFSWFLADCFAEVEKEDKRVVEVRVCKRDFLQLQRDLFITCVRIKPYYQADLWLAKLLVGRDLKLGEVTLAYEKMLKPKGKRIQRSFHFKEKAA